MNKALTPITSLIVAMAENRVIGKHNQLPWRLPADLKRFKAITTGHPILMGRKTYESIGKPLPQRSNIIITRDQTFTADGCIIAQSINDAIQQARNIDQNEIFIIGGADIYRQIMPLTQRIYLTVIHHPFDGDAYFPELNKAEWQEISREEYQADDDNRYPYTFFIYTKR